MESATGIKQQDTEKDRRMSGAVKGREMDWLVERVSTGSVVCRLFTETWGAKVEEHFGFSSRCLLKLLRPWIRAAWKLISVPEQWWEQVESDEILGGGGQTHLQANKQLDTKDICHLPCLWRMKCGSRAFMTSYLANLGVIAQVWLEYTCD